jgi:hypothetical protein
MGDEARRGQAAYGRRDTKRASRVWATRHEEGKPRMGDAALGVDVIEVHVARQTGSKMTHEGEWHMASVQEARTGSSCTYYRTGGASRRSAARSPCMQRTGNGTARGESDTSKLIRFGLRELSALQGSSSHVRRIQFISPRLEGEGGGRWW